MYTYTHVYTHIICTAHTVCMIFVCAHIVNIIYNIRFYCVYIYIYTLYIMVGRIMVTDPATGMIHLETSEGISAASWTQLDLGRSH